MKVAQDSATHWLILAFVMTLVNANAGWSFDNVDTHPRISEAALRVSSVDARLKNELELENGINTPLRAASGQVLTGLQWLSRGSRLEDVPLCRASNHFHNPLRPFTTSGMSDVPPARLLCSGFVSNVTWGTQFTSPANRGPDPGNLFDWGGARRAYVAALMLEAPAEREASLARAFETLGHVGHLIQDVAVPAHARNDFLSHLEFSPTGLSPTHWVENSFERFVRRNATLVDHATPLIPQFSSQPLASFWDADQYDGRNPKTTVEHSFVGLAEYTNANFASANTIFTESFAPDDAHFFPYPRQSSTNVEALVGQSFEVVRLVTSEDGQIDRGLYISKVTDGEVINNFARAGYLTPAIIENAPPLSGAVLRLTLQLDDIVHADYAAKLVPKAIGYSKALFDYFFRGRLDGDVVIDPDDPNTDAVRFSGINTSPEALGGGALQLYGENAAGIRTPLVALDADVAVSAEPGAAVRSARFAATGDAEKFVAVYRGALGNEQPGTDAQTAPGAVIGKVLGGPRVEQIFSDGTRWYLRTPDGVVALPILATDIEDLRWGDVDNTLVGRSKLGLDPDARNLFRAYRINRPVGSITVPTTTDAGGMLLVDAVQTMEATLPAELAIGTIVHFAGSARVTEDLATFEGGARSFGYDPSTGEYVPLGRPDGRPEAPGGSEVTIERTVDQARAVTADFPVLLTKATYNNPAGLNYFWRLVEIGLDASDRLLALVEVILTEPANANGSVTVKRRNALTGVLEPAGEVLTRVSFPISPLLLALVDVRTQQVVATTAAPEVILGVDSVTPTTRMQGHATALGHDGPLDGQVITRWFELPLRAHVEPPAPPGDTPETPFLANVTVAQESGVTRLQITGRYTPTLAALVQSDITIQQSEPVRQPYLFAIEPDGNGFPVFRGFNVDTTFFGPVGYSATLQQGQRLRPSPVGEIVLLFGEPVGISEGEKGVLVRLTPSDTARLVLTDELPPAATHRLVGTTSKRTLVVSRGFETVSRLADLEAGTVAEFFGDDLGQQFVLLDPTRLYNVDDLRFYRPAPPLVKTALPRRLAGVTDNPRGDYHTIETK